jgi:hypothetical protein
VLSLGIALFRGVGFTHRRMTSERMISPDGRHIVEESKTGF